LSFKLVHDPRIIQVLIDLAILFYKEDLETY